MTISFAHLIVIALVLMLVIFPIGKVLNRAGWNGWLSLLWLIPIVNVVMLWVFAYSRWPNLPDNSAH